jgi:hypothetical protein
MQLKGLKIVHLSCTRVSLVVFVVSFFNCIVIVLLHLLPTMDICSICSEVVHVLFFY